MTQRERDDLVEHYLNHLASDLDRLPRDEREAVLADVADHIREARAAILEETDASVRALLDRLGRPSEIAFAAGATSKSRRWPTGSIALGFAAAVVLALASTALAVSLTGSGFVGRTRAMVISPPPIMVRQPMPQRIHLHFPIAVIPRFPGAGGPMRIICTPAPGPGNCFILPPPKFPASRVIRCSVSAVGPPACVPIALPTRLPATRL